MSKLRQRSVFGVLVVVLGGLLFVVTSAFLVDRGLPRILAGIAGGLAFPLLPVAWHVWAERTRKRVQAEAKKPSRSTLTGFDRFWLRFVVVVVVVVGPMVLIAKAGVVRATLRHGLWFLPAFQPGIGTLGEGPHRDLSRLKPLLERVPVDAEGVVAYLPHDVRGEAVLAFTNRDLVAAAEGDIERDDDTIRHINDTFKDQHFVLLDPIAMVIDRDLTVAASDRWKGKVEPPPGGPSSVLRRELERAPGDAEVIVALAPRTIRELKMIRSGVIWARPHGHELVLEARLEATDVRRAYELITSLRQLAGAEIPVSASCKPAVAAVLGHVELAQVGTVVTARAVLSESAAADLSHCTE